MFFRVFAPVFALLLIASCDENPLSDTPSAAQAGRMEALIAASPTYSAIPQQCPLAIYKTGTRSFGDVPDCARFPGTCLEMCDAGNADACFDAARVVERFDIAKSSRSKYPLFMAACRYGFANACVNAAATVKNGNWSVPRPAAADGDSCQFRTYDRMCRDGAPWGCYMRAQEYLTGSSHVSKSNARYEASMRQACQIDAESGACSSEFRN